MKNWKKFAVAPCIVVLCLIFSVSTGPGRSSAEPATPQTIQESSPVVMIALPWDDPSIRIPPPQQFRAESAPTANFLINYLGAGTPDGQGASCLAWTPAAQAAFSYAANVWATMITSNVPIRISACWANLGSPSILGYSWSNIAPPNFAGAPQSNTLYNYSLANALAGSDLDPVKPDFYITYNNGFSWYFGTDGSTPAGQYDFVSVVMHEMGHGLNFAGTMSYGLSQCGGASNGCWGLGSGYPGIYDRFTENGTGQALISAFPNSSAALGGQLTSNNLYFDGINANAANGGSRVKIFAPSTWAPGSSYSHLDFETFRYTPNKLMVYAIPSASSIHDPGPVTVGILKDLGWTQTVNNPVPTITGLNPLSAMPGGPGFTLIVNGTNFVSGSVVRWNGADRATTYGSATQLTAAITAADIAAVGTASVTVFNPAPGGGTSNAASFSVGNPVPAISGLNPFSATPGGPEFMLAVNGTNFVNGSVVRWNGTDRATTYVSDTQLTAAISAADIVAAGMTSVTVFSPGPGGGTSNAASFLVGAPKKVYLPMALKSLPPPPAQLSPFADTTVLQGAPTFNAGNTTDMWVGYEHCGDVPNGIARSLIQFDTSIIPPNTAIASARLYAYLDNSCDIGNRTHTVTSHRVTSDWSEMGATWNNKPGYDGQYGSAAVSSRNWGWYSFDIAELVRGWVNGNFPNYGVMLRANESSGDDSARLGFLTRNMPDASYRPYLSLTYAGVSASSVELPPAGAGTPSACGDTIWQRLSTGTQEATCVFCAAQACGER